MELDAATLAAIAAIIGAISGSIASLLPILWSRRKTRADATKIIEEAASSLVLGLEKRVKELMDEVSALREENRELSRRVVILESENEDLKRKNAELSKKLNGLAGSRS